jgi:C4-dicarboxylate-specific signal transduction histidine kinase
MINDKRNGPSHNTNNQTSADPDRRFGYLRLHPRSISSSGNREFCPLRWARHSVLSLATSERSSDHGDHLLSGRYIAKAYARRRATVDGCHQLVVQPDGDLVALAVLPASATAEDLLQRAHDELETRVEARTHELATVNQALVTEIKNIWTPSSRFGRATPC